MDNAANASLTETFSFGYWLGGFIIPMLVAFVFLRFAGSPKRKPSTALALRWIGVAGAAVLAFAGYLGAGGAINPGGVLAVLVSVAWAIKQHTSSKST